MRRHTVQAPKVENAVSAACAGCFRESPNSIPCDETPSRLCRRMLDRDIDKDRSFLEGCRQVLIATLRLARS